MFSWTLSKSLYKVLHYRNLNYHFREDRKTENNGSEEKEKEAE